MVRTAENTIITNADKIFDHWLKITLPPAIKSYKDEQAVFIF